MNTHWPVFGQNSGLVAQIASTRRDFLSAYQLVYEAYLEKGYIEPHPSGIVYEEALGRSTTRTIVCKAAGEQVVGTVTLVGDGEAGLLAERVYPVEVQALRAEGRRLAELSCLAVRPNQLARRGDVFFSCTELMIHYAYRQRYDDILLVFHPRKMRFYSRWFRVLPVGPCRPYASLPGAPPGVCCRIDLHSLKRNLDSEVNSMYFSRTFPDYLLDRPGISLSEHRRLCALRGVTESSDYEGFERLHAPVHQTDGELSQVPLSV